MVKLLFSYILVAIKNKKKDKKMNDGMQKQHKPIEIANKEQGKFVELPGAEMGKVVVRFPPEASGLV